MACNAQFEPTLNLSCIQEGIADLRADKRWTGVKKMAKALGDFAEMRDNEEGEQLVGAVSADPELLAAIDAVEAELPKEGAVAAGVSLSLLLMVLQLVLKAVAK